MKIVFPPFTVACLLIFLIPFHSILGQALPGHYTEASAKQLLRNIDSAIKAHDTAVAKRQIWQIIHTTENDFGSRRIADYVRGTALYMKAEIAYNEDNDEQGARESFMGAWILGNAQAPEKISILENPGEKQDSVLLVKQLKYLRKAAELGDKGCMYKTQLLLSYFQKDELEFNYWGILGSMGEDSTSIADLMRTTASSDPSELLPFKQALKKFSIDGGAVRSTVPGLPGRSILTAAYVDLFLRTSLRDYWWQVWKPVDNGRANTLESAFKGAQTIVKHHNPASAVYLLTNTHLKTHEKSIPFDPANLLGVLLPGDQVFVRCGVLGHIATVWKIDKVHQKLYFLDPFYEFWQPSHNVCISHFSQDFYTNGRYLTVIDAGDVQKIIVAIFTTRDRS